MIEFTMKLNPETRDLILDENDDFVLAEGDECTVQNITNTLNAWKGEFLFDETHGTEYEQVLGNSTLEVLDGTAELVIREAVLQEPEVGFVYDVDATSSSDHITATFGAELNSGAKITQEVNESD